MRITIPKTLTMAAAAVVIGTSPVMAGKSNDTLIWATDREADVALPYYNNIREMVIMARLAWDTLIYRDTKTFEYRPQLATSWKWIGNLAIEMNLRKGVKFHDGSDFDAEDVAGTFNHLVKKESGVLTRRNVNWMKNVEVLGPYKIRINLVKPFPAAFEFLSGALPVFSSDIWKTAKMDAKGKLDYGTVKPMGTGPYKITEVVPGEFIKMEINKNYWNGSPKGSKPAPARKLTLGASMACTRVCRLESVRSSLLLVSNRELSWGSRVKALMAGNMARFSSTNEINPDQDFTHSEVSGLICLPIIFMAR